MHNFLIPQSAHTRWLRWHLNKVVTRHCEYNKICYRPGVFLSFLDLKKVIDTVNRNILLQKTKSPLFLWDYVLLDLLVFEKTYNTDPDPTAHIKDLPWTHLFLSPIYDLINAQLGKVLSRQMMLRFSSLGLSGDLIDAVVKEDLTASSIAAKSNEGLAVSSAMCGDVLQLVASL